MGSGGHHGAGWDPFVEIPQLCDCPPATSRDGGLLDGAYSWREGAFFHHLHPLADEAADGNAFLHSGLRGKFSSAISVAVLDARSWVLGGAVHRFI